MTGFAPVAKLNLEEANHEVSYIFSCYHPVAYAVFCG